jgi:hypothetical protein
LIEIQAFQLVLGTTARVTGTGREFVEYQCMIPQEEVHRLAEKHGSTEVKSWLTSTMALKTWILVTVFSLKISFSHSCMLF